MSTRYPYAFGGQSLAAAGLLLWQTMALAQVPTWTVDPEFAKGRGARMNISGAACAPTEPVFQFCLAVNDDKKYAQFFRIDGTRIVPDQLIRLLGENADHDPDTEAAAYDDGYFYVLGSHGRSRPGTMYESVQFVFRFPATSQFRSSPFALTDDSVNPAIERSPKLREMIRAAPYVGPFFQKPLADGGVNIEGVAVKDGRMFLGFRAPSIDGSGFIMDVAVDSVFGEAAADAKVHALQLGADTGIRDLGRVSGGLLVLAGSTRDEPIPTSLFFWEGTTDTVKKLSGLDLSDVPPGAKAETVLVLDEQPNHYRVLIMFDGIANGGPREFSIPR
jgi:Protein of unknown function (DUF3616)